MDENFKKELNEFLGKAMLATYAGSGPEADSGTGFTELEFKEGDYLYRDSYTGFFQSWGREVVWYNGKPFWVHVYGGGMKEEFWDDKDFAHQTFQFLKKALSEGEKIEEFQPRGPKLFSDGDWKYECEWIGNITQFEGSENISLKDKIVFTHHFFGGLVK